MSRRLWVALAALGLLLLLVAVAGWLLLETYGGAFARNRLAGGLGRALQRPVSLERVELNPWLLRGHVYGLVVPARAPGQPALLQVGHARVSLALSSLWRGQLTLRALLEDVALHLTPEADGTASPPPLTIPDRFDVGSLTIGVAEVRVARGHLVYAQPPPGMRVEVVGLSGSAWPAARDTRVAARADAVLIRAGGAAETFRRVAVEGQVEEDRLQVASLTARWEDQPVTIQGEVFELHTPPKLRFTVRAQMDLARLAKRAGLDIPVQGRADVSAEVQGEIGAPEIAGTITAPALTVGPVTGRQAFLRGRWADGRLTVSEMRAQLWGGRVQGAARVAPGRLAETEARLRLEGITLQALPPALGLPGDVRGTAAGTVELSGDPRRLESVRGRFDLAVAGLLLPGPAQRLGAGSADLAGTFVGQTADLARADARWPGLQLQARGGLSADGPRALQVVLGAALQRIGAAWGRPELDGQATLRAELGGTWRALAATGRLSIPVLAVAGTALSDVEARLRYAGATLRVTAAQAMLGQSRVTAEGTAGGPPAWQGLHEGLPDPLRFHVEIEAPALRLADLQRWIPPRFQTAGTVRLAATMSGTPAAWQAAGRLVATRLAGPAGLVVEDATAPFTLDLQGVTVSALRATVAGVPVGGTGRYAWGGAGQADLVLGPARLAGLPRVPAGLGLEGTGRGEAHLALRPGGLSGTATLTLHDVSTTGLALGDGTGELVIGGDRLQGVLAFPDAGVRVRIEGPLDAAATLDGSVVLRDVSVQPLLGAALPRQPVDVSGTVSAQAVLAIPLGAPSQTRVRATLDPVALTIAGDAWRNPGPVVVRWESGALHLERVRLESRLGSLSARGLVEPSGKLDVEVSGLVPLGILPALRPEVREAQGTLALTGSLQGTTASPRIRGEGRLQGATLALRDYPDVFREVHAEFVVSQTGLRLTRAAGMLGTGRFEAEGTAILEGRRLGNYRFRLRGQELPLSPLEGLRTVWDADVELVGSTSRGLLQGEARLRRGSYTQDLSLLALLLRPKPGAAAGPDFNLHLKLALSFPSPLMVRTELARMPVGGRMRLEGTLDSPVLFGTLEAGEGRIVFRSQEFEIVSARARFADPRRIDPILDVEARAEIRQYRVTLHLTGRSADLNVRFSASPPLPQEDLLALVVFGVTREEFGQAAGGIVAGEAVHLLVQEFLGIQPGGGLAGFQVDVARSGAGAGVLRVERDLTERARVVYSQELGGEGERRLRVEYRLLGPLLIAGEQNFQGGYGADLVLRMRFR